METVFGIPENELGWGARVGVPGVFRAVDGALPELHDRIERLNRRARRIGAQEIKLVKLGTSLRPRGRSINTIPEPGEAAEVEVFTYFEIEGRRPKVNGWEFIAALEHAGEAGTIIRAAPGREGTIPAEFRSAKNTCQHCGMIRSRIETFLLRHEDGRWAQIGRNCLQDFIGTTTLAGIAADAEIAFAAGQLAVGLDDEEGGWGGGGESRTVSLPTYLGFVAAAIRSWGWMSRGEARARADAERSSDIATADAAMGLMRARPEDFKPRNGRPPLYVRENLPTADDFAHAKAALEWVTTDMASKADLSDYEHNVVVLSKLGAARPKNLGLAASIVAVFDKAMDRLHRAKRVADAGAGSQHVGKVGERRFFKAEILSCEERAGDFGITYLIKMVDDAGNLITSFTGVRLGDRGETVHFKATVKKHSEFKGAKETLITRPDKYTAEQFAEAVAKDAAKAERAAKRAAKKAAKEAAAPARTVWTENPDLLPPNTKLND